MHGQITPSGRANVVCTACFSPDVVAMDSTGAPVCLVHRAGELFTRQSKQEAAADEIDRLVGFVLEEGKLHPDDATEAVSDAIRVAVENRERLGLHDVPTISETEQALAALAEWNRLDLPGDVDRHPPGA